MPHLRRFVLTLSTAALLVGPAGTQTAPVVQAAGFAGTWATDFGPMTLWVTGPLAVGSYGDANAIEGRIAGRRFVFAYREPSIRGEGFFELSADGQSIAGKWRPAGTEAWANWNGSKLAASPPKPSFAGSWTTTFGRMRLRQDGDRVQGTYTLGGGSTIDGRVIDGHTLDATYSEPDGTVGRATFRLVADGKRFAGVWRPGKDLPSLPLDAESAAIWGGEKVAAVAARTWLIVLEAHWETNVSMHEFSYGAMLRAYFERTPDVAFRHRFFHDQPDLERFLRECATIDEPVYLYISSHGTPAGVAAGGKTIDGQAIGKALTGLADLRLLHFGGCSLLAGDLAKSIRSACAPLTGFPISGFTRNVDWAGSALVDFTYLDLVLGRGMTPKDAVAETRKMLTFAGKATPESSPIPAADLVIDVP